LRRIFVTRPAVIRATIFRSVQILTHELSGTLKDVNDVLIGKVAHG
jgi:hypothetical protein